MIGVLYNKRFFSFQVDYACMDGSANNRAFLKMHFSGHPADSKYTCRDPLDPKHSVVFLMDPSVCTVYGVTQSIFNLEADRKNSCNLWMHRY